MIAIPSLTPDVGIPAAPGAPVAEGTSMPPEDPVSATRRIAALGFTRLHLAELRARATGSGREGARELLRTAPLLVQAEVHDQDEPTIADLLSLGAQWIVAGSVDLDGASRFADLAARVPGRLILDLEPMGTARWDPRRSSQLFDLIAELETLDLGGVLVGESHAGAAPSAATLTLIEDLVNASPWPVQVRCAPDSLQALRNLEVRGVSGALFEGTASGDGIDLRLIAEEFAE